MRNRFRGYSPEGVRACIHMMLIVVLFVCIGMRSCAHSHEPGCFFEYEAKIPASIASADGIEFIENNGWTPKATPGTSVYIISVPNSSASTCTIILDSVDPLRRSYASNVPLSSLNYVETNLGSVTSSGHFSVVVYNESSDHNALEIALDVVIVVIAMYLLGLLSRYIVRTLWNGR